MAFKVTPETLEYMMLVLLIWSPCYSGHFSVDPDSEICHVFVSVYIVDTAVGAQQMLMSLWGCVMQGFMCLQEAFSQLLTAPLIAFQADQPPILQNEYSMYNTSLLGIPLPKPGMSRGSFIIPNPVAPRS